MSSLRVIGKAPFMRLVIIAHRPASKRLLTAFVLVLALAPSLRAQGPAPTSQVLTFSGNMPGQPDGPVAVRLRLYETNVGGTLQFEETQTVTVAAERFLVRIGEATAGGVPATVSAATPRSGSHSPWTVRPTWR